ncbi:hypothetical protein C8Q79DRAFT_579313 [Trametes meyenii]|nr:hypothetical protein C8Q79DRAFT_579313 [Trametes meyenii]
MTAASKKRKRTFTCNASEGSRLSTAELITRHMYESTSSPQHRSTSAEHHRKGHSCTNTREAHTQPVLIGVRRCLPCFIICKQPIDAPAAGPTERREEESEAHRDNKNTPLRTTVLGPQLVFTTRSTAELSENIGKQPGVSRSALNVYGRRSSPWKNKAVRDKDQSISVFLGRTEAQLTSKDGAVDITRVSRAHLSLEQALPAHEGIVCPPPVGSRPA